MNILLRTVAIIVVLLCMGLDWFSSGPKSNLDKYWNASNSESRIVIDHSVWQQLLDDYLVQDESGVNLIDYEGVQDSAAALHSYIDSLAAVDPRILNRSEQMGYWINLYNALTVQLVAKSYPVESIRKLGDSLFSKGPWDDEITSISGRDLSLNDIEHRILRPVYQDYRIHFAVNCASIGCPNLAPTVYTTMNLEQLLEQAARSYLLHPRGVSFLEGELKLSSLFKWYQGDFGSSEKEMLNTLAKYLEPEMRERITNFQGQIKYEYDWQLNGLD